MEKIQNHLLKKKRIKVIAKNLGMRISVEALEGLSEKVLKIVSEAAERAIANKRRTINLRDL